MKSVVVILATALVTFDGSAARAQDAAAASSTEAAAEKIEDPEEAALMAPGALAPGSLGTRIQSTLDTATLAPNISNQLAEDPVIRERVRARFRADLPDQNPDIGDVLGLSQVQVEKLFDLLTRQNEDARRATAAGASAKANADRIRGDEAELTSLLGKKYPQWQKYRTEAPARMQIRDLNGALYAYDIPLSDAQTGQLMSAFTLVAASRQSGQRDRAFTRESHGQLLEAATPHLSAEQLDVYRKVLDRQASRSRPR